MLREQVNMLVREWTMANGLLTFFQEPFLILFDKEASVISLKIDVSKRVQ